MNFPNIDKERLDAEAYLTEKQTDFVTTYMTVANLQFLVQEDIEQITKNTVNALLSVLKGSNHTSQRQVFFLHKKAADALGAIIHTTENMDLANHSKNALIHILDTTTGHPCRAAAEALGTIPLDIKGPHLPQKISIHMPTISWQFLIKEAGFCENHTPEWKGRNVITFSKDHRQVLVVKLACKNGTLEMLAEEGRWMDFLFKKQPDFMDNTCLFNIPRPVKISESFVFKLKNLPINIPDGSFIDHSFYATGFIAPADYFCYPNELLNNRPYPKETVCEIIGRNAWILGKLTSFGIIHTAPIPLFHNRVQRNRRNDGGLYQWSRGGRLDQWLNSCRFPNIGKTGVRDFEHFISFDGSSRKLYEHIGTHILSLLLIAGSYFRNKNPRKTGFDDTGKPVDARDLFDFKLLKKIIREIFQNYFHGFTGEEFGASLPMDIDLLASRMIEEMGIDRHMEEILRKAEQNIMSDQAFVDFLISRGFDKNQIAQMEKGEKDITILTGPHLGGFNERISVPELIEFTAASAALCISNRYCREKFAA